MFDDEDPFNFKKIHELSAVDGFVEVGECVAEMINFVANEPSAGLFYIQQHIQNSAPHLIHLKNNVAEKSREMALHTEDSEDSISMVRSMRDYGYIIADDMIKDIASSLAIIGTKQPKKGLITSSSSWSPSTWGRNSSDDAGSSSYLSNVMRSTKLGNFGWNRAEFEESSGQERDPSDGNNSSETTAEGEAEELRLLNQVPDEVKVVQSDQSMSKDELVLLAEKYDELKADKEAKLQEWLRE